MGAPPRVSGKPARHPQRLALLLVDEALDLRADVRYVHSGRDDHCRREKQKRNERVSYYWIDTAVMGEYLGTKSTGAAW